MMWIGGQNVKTDFSFVFWLCLLACSVPALKKFPLPVPPFFICKTEAIILSSFLDHFGIWWSAVSPRLQSTYLQLITGYPFTQTATQPSVNCRAASHGKNEWNPHLPQLINLHKIIIASFAKLILFKCKTESLRLLVLLKWGLFTRARSISFMLVK